MQTADHNSNVVHTMLLPLDEETRRLLDAFARIVRKPPALVARDLLRDLLIDDAGAHRPF